MSEVENVTDEQIGNGSTTLDYLKYVHPWLKNILDEKDKQIAALTKKVKDFEDIMRRGGC